MKELAGFTPEQGRLLWQWYLSSRQQNPHIQQNFPQRRPIDEVSPHRVFVLNTEAEVIPPYACMRITGVDVVGGQTVVKVEKPSSTEGEFLFNCQFEIPVASGSSAGVGWAYRYGIVIMLGDGTAPTAANVAYRPVVDSWVIEEGGGPFVVFGVSNVATNAVVGRFDGGRLNVQHGIVTANLGCGYYTIEKGTWAGDMQDAGVGLGSDYGGSADCDVCQDVVGAGTDACGITLTYAPCQVNGTGVYVTAYDEASALIPLVVGTSVKMLNMGDVDTYTGTPIWQILRGVMTHTVQYKERWECCDGTYESGIETLIGRTPVILIGKECDEIICGTCDV